MVAHKGKFSLVNMAGHSKGRTHAELRTKGDHEEDRAGVKAGKLGFSG